MSKKCQSCGQDLPNDVWKDPEVMAALKEGRSADDIAVLLCPKCDRYGYYNQGSHFYCRFCRRIWYCRFEGEIPIKNCPSILCEDAVTLADTVTEVTDGYHNETRTP